MTSLLGVPACPGSPDSEEHAEPARLRRDGLVSELAARGMDVVDVGDVPDLPAVERPPRAPGATRLAGAVVDQALRVQDAVEAALRTYGPPLVVLGGDCSLVLGALPGSRAALRRPLGLVWLGRFANLNVPATSPSGDLAGMALALLCGEGDPAVVSALGAPHLHGRDVRLVARELDPGEDAVLEACTIRLVPLEALEPPSGPLYVNVECGLLDLPDGPALATVEAALRGLAATREIAVLALTGTSPARLGAAGAATLITAALAGDGGGGDAEAPPPVPAQRTR